MWWKEIWNIVCSITCSIWRQTMLGSKTWKETRNFCQTFVFDLNLRSWRSWTHHKIKDNINRRYFFQTWLNVKSLVTAFDLFIGKLMIIILSQHIWALNNTAIDCNEKSITFGPNDLVDHLVLIGCSISFASVTDVKIQFWSQRRRWWSGQRRRHLTQISQQSVGTLQ